MVINYFSTDVVYRIFSLARPFEWRKGEKMGWGRWHLFIGRGSGGIRHFLLPCTEKSEEDITLLYSASPKKRRGRKEEGILSLFPPHNRGGGGGRAKWGGGEPERRAKKEEEEEEEEEGFPP